MMEFIVNHPGIVYVMLPEHDGSAWTEIGTLQGPPVLTQRQELFLMAFLYAFVNRN